MPDYNWRNDKPQEVNRKSYPVCNVCGGVIWGVASYVNEVGYVHRWCRDVAVRSKGRCRRNVRR